MKKILLLAFVVMLSPLAARAQHEYSPLVEKTVNYKNWTLPNLKTDQPADLRSLVPGKKLVMIVYFAPWCGNWKFEAPVVAKLYQKYKDQGFEVIGVSEYGARADVKAFFGDAGPGFPVVTESETRETNRRPRTTDIANSPAIRATRVRPGTSFSIPQTKSDRRRPDRKGLGR